MPTAQAAQTFERVCEHVRQTALLISIDALLGWDERCLMPPAAGEYRADQMTLLSGMVHDRLTDPRLGDWLNELAASPLASDPISDTGATIRQLKRHYEKKVKLPKTLVEELTRTSVLGQQVWQEARRKKDFSSFQPLLERMVQLKREEASAFGYAECPYDALLDEYEQGERTSNVRRVLAALREELVPLVAAIRETGRQADVSILQRHYPVEVQNSTANPSPAANPWDSPEYVTWCERQQNRAKPRRRSIQTGGILTVVPIRADEATLNGP